MSRTTSSGTGCSAVNCTVPLVSVNPSERSVTRSMTRAETNGLRWFSRPRTRRAAVRRAGTSRSASRPLDRVRRDLEHGPRCAGEPRTSASWSVRYSTSPTSPIATAALAWRSARAAGRLHHGDGECPTTPHFVRHVGDAPSPGGPLSATQALDHRPPEEPRHDHLIPEPRDKAMARHLRAALADRGVTVSHAEALELVARQLGMRDWNTLAAASSATPAAALGRHVHPARLRRGQPR